MQRPNLIDLRFDSDSLSMAEDCESLLSISSDHKFLPLQETQMLYESPVFRKTSGEEILMLTELFLPAKRERIYTEKNVVGDYKWLRKRERYYYELKEYYQELDSLVTQVKNDDLLKENQNYLSKKAKKLEIEARECQDKQEKWNFIDFASPLIQMIDLESVKDRIAKRKGRVKRLVFYEKPSKTKKIEFFTVEKSSNSVFSHSLFDNIIQRPKISFSFHKPIRGQPRIKINQSIAIEKKQKSEHKTYFTAGSKINAFRFDPISKPVHFFIHSFPTSHQLSSLIFNEKSDPDYTLIKDSLSQLFTIPVEALPETDDSKSSSASFSESEELENPVLNKDLVTIDSFHHCKFVYKYHLGKKYWTTEELTNFHRPKVRLSGLIQILMDTDPVDNLSAKVNPNSYLHFPKYQSLTLAEGRFIVCEYIEQFPLLLQNSGMASKVCNYYTKDINEDYMGDVGVNQTMDKYSSIRVLDEGKNLAFIENSLFIAPIFHHPSKGRDFLLVKTIDGRWIGRIFSKVFTIGQQECKVEVFQPKSKFHREVKDKHLLSVLYEKLFFNNNEISKEKMKKIVDKLKYKKNLKKTLADIKIVKKEENWVCEKTIEKDDFQKIIQPEEFVCYESLLAGQQKLQNLGISLMSNEKLLNSLLTLKKELTDSNVHHIAGFIEEQVALTPWNLTSSYLRGKKKSNYLLQGRADPTCGLCGYAFEVLPRFTNKDLAMIKEQIRKNVDKEIKVLGNSWYKNDSSEDSEDIEDEPIDYSMFYENSNGKNLENTENDSDLLQGFVESLQKLKEPKPTVRKVLKRTIIYPLLSGGFKKVIKYSEDPAEVNNFVQKKHPMPKIFQKPKNKTKDQQNQELKEKQKQEKRLKKQEEALKKKEERKLEKAKQKLLIEQEWKNICIEKYNSGAVLFNTGTNANLRCSRCNMVGHVKSNKKLCPAYVEEKLDMDLDSRVVLNMAEVPKAVPKGQKKGKKPKKKIAVVPERAKPKSNRRGIDEFEQFLVNLINSEQDKDLVSKPGGLLSLLEKSEKGHKWTINEFEDSLKSLYNEDYEYIEDDIEDLKFKQELKAPTKPEKKPETKPKKPKKVLEMIEDSDTLIINTL